MNEKRIQVFRVFSCSECYQDDNLLLGYYLNTFRYIMSVIYSELLEDYFLTNIKGDLFSDDNDAKKDNETESHNECKVCWLQDLY